MATNYPGALDTDATVGGGSKPASSDALDYSTGQPTHAGLHQNVGDAIEQIQTKLGTGASSPAANKALVSNGTASEWGQITAAMIASGQSPTFTTVTATNVDATNLTGELQDAAQPNITSVGTLTSLTVSGGVEVQGLLDVSSQKKIEFGNENDQIRFDDDDDEFAFWIDGVKQFQIGGAATGNDIVTKATGTFKSFDSGSQFPTGSGTAAHIITGFGLSALVKNSSVAADKENVSTDLGSYLTADMIDSVVPKMWNRITAPGYPEIGPIADDMETISEFLASHGTDANGDQILMGVDQTAWMSLMTLALQDIRARLAALEG